MTLRSTTSVTDDHPSSGADPTLSSRRLGMFLTLEEAAAELCADVDAARAWLVERDLVRHVAGRELVVPHELAGAVAKIGAADRRPARGGSIHTWRAVAAALGVSEDTVGRRRKEHHDATPCHFADEDEIRDWWRALHAPAPTPSRPPRKRRSAQHGDGPLDVKALVHELTRR